MQFFTWLGAISCGMLYFFKFDTLQISMIFFGLAAIGYSGGFVFYNSYLPEIATLDMQDRVSAKGFTYGYIGSVILQLICFVFVLKPGWFGIADKSFPARLSFLLVASGGSCFAYIPFTVLPKGSPNAQTHHKNLIKGGFIELGNVWQAGKKHAYTETLSACFFLLLDGCANDHAGSHKFWRQRTENGDQFADSNHPDYPTGSNWGRYAHVALVGQVSAM